jgi:hypothetical protein
LLGYRRLLSRSERCGRGEQWINEVLTAVVIVVAAALIIGAGLAPPATTPDDGVAPSGSGRSTTVVLQSKQSPAEANASFRIGSGASRRSRSNHSGLKMPTPSSASWRRVQAQFVDDPRTAVVEADRLIEDVMRARGYPVEDSHRRLDDLSVDHAQVVHHYRAGSGDRRAPRTRRRDHRGSASGNGAFPRAVR